jgi:hypothetical protein
MRKRIKAVGAELPLGWLINPSSPIALQGATFLKAIQNENLLLMLRGSSRRVWLVPG